MLKGLTLVLIRSLPISIFGGGILFVAAKDLSLSHFASGASFFLTGTIMANLVGFLGWHLRKAKVGWVSAWIMAAVFTVCLEALMIWELEAIQEKANTLDLATAAIYFTGLLIILGMISVPYFHWINRRFV